MRSRPKSRQKHVLAPFWGEDPQILDLVFKIAPFSDDVAKFRGDRPRDRGDLALNKKRKKETAAKHKGSRVALSQRAALTICSCQMLFYAGLLPSPSSISPLTPSQKNFGSAQIP